MQIRDTPHAIAGGIAIGVFVGFTPLLGFKTLLAIVIAWLLRCSKISAAVGVTFHDILWIIWPLILRWQFVIGYWVWSHPHHGPPPLMRIRHVSLEQFLDWHAFAHLIWPLFIGSIIMGIPIALVSYFVSFGIITRYQAKAKEKAAPEPPPENIAP